MRELIHTRAVVLGAGLIGSAAALELARRGVATLLVEKGSAGAAASGVNYGGVRRQGRPVEQLPLAQRAHAIWSNLKAHVGIDGEYVRSGHLKLARDERDLASLIAYRDETAEYGLDLEIRDASALRRRFPWIRGVAGGSFCPEDGHANPRLVAPAFARAAVGAGARLIEHAAIDHVERRGDRFVLRSGSAYEIRCDFLLNCAGAWAGWVAEAFGEPVPMRSIYPNMLVTEPLPPFMTASIGIEGGGIYGRQVERGNCVLGGGRGIGVGTDRALPSNEATLTLMRTAAAIFPALRGAHVIRSWSGVEGAMPGGNPIIGPSRTTPNLFHAFGFSGGGFQLAPAVGAVLAELATTGETATPIQAFAIGAAPADAEPMLEEAGSNVS